jgi:hypothetical protein
MNPAAYDVFTRTWWRRNPGHGWPRDLEPGAGRKRYIARRVTLEEARAIAQAWNFDRYGDLHGDPAAKAAYDRTLPRHLGLKAEFESR